MKLTVTFEVDDDLTTYDHTTQEDVPMIDPDHPMGVTEAGYTALGELLAQISFFAVGRGNERSEQGHLAMPDISSTEVRARLSAGESCAGLVPAPILALVQGGRWYQKARTPSRR